MNHFAPKPAQILAAVLIPFPAVAIRNSSNEHGYKCRAGVTQPEKDAGNSLSNQSAQ
jgi:hypothetical protein